MHERLKINENAGSSTLVCQVALVDDERGVLMRTMDRQQGRARSEVVYWDLRTGRLEPDPHGYPKAHTSRCFSSNGRYLIVVTRKEVHHIWDRATRTAVAKLDIPPEYGALHVSDDAQVVALAGKEVAVWQGATGGTRPLRALKEGINLLSPSGKHLVGPPGASIYDAQSGAKLFTFPAHAAFGAFSPDSRSFLHSYNQRAKLFDLETGQKRESLVSPFELIGGAVSLDHTRIAVGGIFGGARVWQVPSEDILATWNVRDRYIRRLCFSGDGSRLVAASDSGALRLLDVAAGTERACLIVLKNDAWVTLTPDGYFIGSDNLADHVQWQIDGKEIAFDRYAKDYHRPKRVAQALAI
jgi:WD40 repeat protein